MTIHSSLVFVAAAALGLASTACGSDPVEPPASPAGGTDEPVADEPVADKSPAPAGTGGDRDSDSNPSSINISDKIKKACGISDAEANFAFNQANIRPQDAAVLKKLAECFTTGPLKAEDMLLVGHADPRGDEEYNYLLGERRADAVKKFLITKGMKGDQATTSSRGELDATGTDTAGWAADRRVDVKLK